MPEQNTETRGTCERCGGTGVLNTGRRSGWSKLPLERPCPHCTQPDPQTIGEDPRVEVVAQVISGHVTTDDDFQQDFCHAVARDVLKALDAPTFPPSHFAHRFQEDGWPR